MGTLPGRVDLRVGQLDKSAALPHIILTIHDCIRCLPTASTFVRIFQFIAAMAAYQATIYGEQRKDEGSDQAHIDPTSTEDSGWIMPIGDLAMSTEDIINVVGIELFSEIEKAAREEKPLREFFRAFCYIRQQIRERIELCNSKTDYIGVLVSIAWP